MCKRCALALDQIDDGEGCISLDTWHGYACVESIGPLVWVGACEVTFFIGCDRTCGEIMSICLLAQWHYMCRSTMLHGTTIISIASRIFENGKYVHYISATL